MGRHRVVIVWLLLLSIVAVSFLFPAYSLAGVLEDALDNPIQTNGSTPLSFSTGSVPWSAVTTTYYSGGASAQSGDVNDREFTRLETTVTGTASVSFYQKVSSEPTNDGLSFYIDTFATPKSKITGSVNWQQKSFVVSKGTHTFRWEYKKNATVSRNMDAAWVDKVVVSPHTAVKVTSPNGGEVIANGSTVTITWNAPAAAEKYDLFYSMDSGATWPGKIATNITSTYLTGATYSWTVPAQNGNKAACKVKVVAKNNANVVVGSDISDKPFTIEVLRVTFPNGGETISAKNNPNRVFFTIYGPTTTTKAVLSYSIDGGATWPAIGTKGGISGPGDYVYGSWDVPSLPALKNAKVKVTLKNSAGVVVGTDTSDANFIISPSYTISGTVMQAGKPLADATINLSGAELRTTPTDSRGKYSFTNLLRGGYTVSASKTGSVFTPAARAVTITTANMTTANFTGTAYGGSTYTLSGTVSGATGTGVLLTLSGTKAGTAMTNAAGNYSFPYLPEGNYNLIPAKAGYTFDPVSRGVSLGADTAGVDFTSAAGKAGTTYSIAGKVTYGGVGLGGVTVAVSGAANASVVTDTLGNYVVKGLKKGTYTLIPGLADHDFSPQSITKTIVASSITGIAFIATSLTQYSLYDLTGTWYLAGIRTPVKNTSNPAKFGYDIAKVVLNNNGSGTQTPVSQSDPTGPSTFPPGTIAISSDGVISNGDPNTFLFMNAHKDVVYQLLYEPGVEEQQLSVNMKKAPSYSSMDLEGTWYGAGIKTPMKNNSNWANFGYDVTQLVLASDGSGTATQIASSDSMAQSTFPPGTITISSSGVISDGDPKNSFWFMNMHKNVMYQFFKDPTTGEQQLFVIVKKADSYSAADLAGTWYAAGLKTPVKNTFNSANFGYDVSKLVLATDGSGTAIQIMSSDSTATTTFPAGSMVITGDGVISDGDPNSFWFMNEGKDTMYQLFVDTNTGEQQLFIYLKQVEPYAPVVGTYSISGTVTNLTPQSGSLLVCVTTDLTFNSGCSYGAAADGAGAYSISDIQSGTYYVGAVQDVNGNLQRDSNEPQGAYGAPTGIVVGNDVTDVNFSIGWPLTFSVGTNPSAITIDSNGNAWVSNFGSNSVSKISLNGSIGTVVSYPVGTNPHGINIDSSGNVWVSNYGSNNVMKLNPTNGSILGTFAVGNNPRGLHIDATDNVWVANHGNNPLDSTVTKLGPNGSLVGTYTVGYGPYNIAIDGLKHVWVGNKGGATLGNTITELDSSGAVINTFTVGLGPHGIKIDPYGNVWVANAGNDTTPGSTVTKLDGSGNWMGTFTAGISPHGLGMDVSGNLWVANYGTTSAPGTTVIRLDNNGAPLNLLPSGGNNAAGIAIDDLGNVWISNYNSGNVAVLPGAASAGYHP